MWGSNMEREVGADQLARILIVQRGRELNQRESAAGAVNIFLGKWFWL